METLDACRVRLPTDQETIHVSMYKKLYVNNINALKSCFEIHLVLKSSCYAQLCSVITSIATLAGLEHHKVGLRTGRRTTNVPQWRPGARYHPQHVYMIVSLEMNLKPNLVNLKFNFSRSASSTLG